MSDPLSHMIALLRPRAVFSKGISGAGRWAVHYTAFNQPGFCAVTEGQCKLSVEGAEPVMLQAGDFVLLPTTPAFTMSGLEPARPQVVDPKRASMVSAEIRYGRPDGPADMRQFGGYFTFESAYADVFVSLLPRVIHIRGVPRLTQLVRMVGEETASENAGQALVLERLVELLLIEALRTLPGETAPPGLLRGLADARISTALKLIHEDAGQPWTSANLARASGMSRSTFFDRFTKTVGMRPMEYLQAWRMAVARDLLETSNLSLDDVAQRVGYSSASTFSTAFSRTVGMPPGRFMRLAVSNGFPPTSAHDNPIPFCD
nr:AraC family transcriptional regulator [uncultured Cohaesibacter sp.]